MHSPNYWSDLVGDPSLRVPEFRALRNDEGVAHMAIDGRQYLAVPEDEPYGQLNPQDLPWPQREDLLPKVGNEKGVTVFEVPDEVIALVGLTFGTGRRRTELLRPIYTRIGHLLAGFAGNEMQPNLLSVHDLAYDRAKDRLMFIPPVHFGKHGLAAEQYRQRFVESMAQTFGLFWFPRDLRQLTADVMGEASQ